MSQYLSIREISQYLGIKEKTLYAKVSAKEIPFYRINKLIRFRIEEIDEWMQQKRVQITDPFAIREISKGNRGK